MAFVDGFFTFALQITNTDRNVYESIRVKTAKHPEETPEHLVARVLALAHSYQPGIEFSEGLYRPEQPSIQVPDGIGGLTHWIDVGCPDLKKVRHALGNFDTASLSVYFYEAEQLARFCQSMRGTRKNWIAPVLFYVICPEILVELQETLQLRNSWNCTLVDSALYVESAGRQFNGTIEPQDIWQQFQESIGNVDN